MEQGFVRSNSSYVLTGWMSRFFFLRRNRISTKYFSAFWEFSLLKTVLPQYDRCRLKQDCHLSHLDHSSPWAKARRRACFPGGKCAWLTDVVQREGPGSASCHPWCFQYQLSTSRLYHHRVSRQAPYSRARTTCCLLTLPISLPPNFRENCCRRKKKIRWTIFVML